jgi:hypothetical protein
MIPVDQNGFATDNSWDSYNKGKAEDFGEPLDTFSQMDDFNWQSESNLNETLLHNKHFFSRVSYKNMDEAGNYIVSPSQYKHDDKKHALEKFTNDSVRQHHELLKDQLPEELSKKEHNALYTYTNNDGYVSELLNYHLLGHPKTDAPYMSNHDHAVSQIPHLSSTIAKAKPLDHEAHVYSGMKNFNPEQLANHGKIHTPAFISTSINPEIATGFVGLAKHKERYNKADKQEQHILHFHLPVGYNKGAYIAPHAHPNVSHEGEFLLDKGQNWKLDKHEIVNNVSNYRELSSHVKTHLWTLSPHESVNEAETHRPELFDDNIKGKTKLHKPLFDFNDHSAKFQALDAIASKYDNDALKNYYQHTRLAAETKNLFEANKENLKGGVRLPNYGEKGVKSNSIHRYTRGSTSVNNYLIDPDQFEGKPDEIYDPTAPGRIVTTTRSAVLSKQANETRHDLKLLTHPLKEEVHTYSGTGDNLGLKVGKVVNFPAFTSTSINARTAAMFNTHGPKEKTANTELEHVLTPHHVLHFKLPVGYNKGAYIVDHSDHPQEHEFLLHPNQKFKVTNKQEAHTYINQNDFGSPRKKRYIWTLEPHNDINESTFHDSNFFSGTKHAHLRKFSNLASPSIVTTHTSNLHPHKQADLDLGLHQQHRRLHMLHDIKKDGVPLKIYSINSRGINEGLLGKDKLAFNILHKGTSNKLSQIIEKHGKSLTEEVHAYSGTKNYDPTSQMRKGIIHTPAFTSTSLDPDTAMDFMNKGQEDAHILHFHLPVGYKKSLYVGDHSLVGNEHELLLDKAQTWRLKGHETKQIHYKSDLKNAYDAPLGGFTKNVHIWSLTPHEPINEAVMHTKHFFGSEYNKYSDFKDTPRVQTSRTVNNTLHNELHTQARKEYHDNRDKHEAKIHNSFAYYGGVGSQVINKQLLKEQGIKLPASIDQHDKMNRYREDGSHHGHILNIDEGIRNSKPLAAETHVYSGISSNMEPLLKQGVFTTPAFTSTSFSPRVKYFAGRHDFKIGNPDIDIKTPEDRHIIHFHLPKGYDKGTSNPAGEDEYEYILARNQKWKVTNHETKYETVSKNSYLTPKRYHLWTAVPHEDNVTESTYHDIKHYKALHKVADEFGAGIVSDLHPNSVLDSHLKYIKVKREHYEPLIQNIQNQHKRLSKSKISTYAQRNAVLDYTDDSRNINTKLIHNQTDYMSDDDVHTHKHLQNMFNSPTNKGIPENVHSYSGIKFDKNYKLKVGQTVKLPAYTSSSLDSTIASGFAHVTKDYHKHVLHFDLPKGYKHAKYVAGYGVEHEKELLINAGQHFKVTAHKEWNDGNVTNHVWSLEPHEDN